MKTERDMNQEAMKTSDGVSEQRSVYAAMYRREFASSGSPWFDLYVSLRENGDTHSEAIETIKAEMQMARR